MLEASRTHLRNAGESYFEHMRFATLVGTLAIGAGMACILHAVIPCLCERTCSRTLGSLQRLFADRGQLDVATNENSAVILFVLLIALSCITAIALALSTGGTAVVLMLLPQAFALPLIFLSQNPQLEAAQT